MGKGLYISIPDKAIFAPLVGMRDGIAQLTVGEGHHLHIDDVLLSPQKDPRSVYEVLRGVKLRDKLLEVGNASYRELPVIHISDLTGFYRFHINGPLPDIRGPGSLWDRTTGEMSTEVSGDTLAVYMIGESIYQATVTKTSEGVMAHSLHKHEVDSLSPRHNPMSVCKLKYVWARSWFWGGVHVSGKSAASIITELLYSPERPHNWQDDFSGESEVEGFDVSTRLSDDEIKAVMLNDYFSALQFNDLELYSGSKKTGYYGLDLTTPIEVVGGIGEAWNRSLDYRENEFGEVTNPGLPTLGFNNLRYFAMLLDGFRALLLGREPVPLNVLRSSKCLTSHEDETANYLISIGRRSKIEMVNDPLWVKLRPTTQRRILKACELSSTSGAITGTLVSTREMQRSLPAVKEYTDLWSNWWFQGRYFWATGCHDTKQMYRYFSQKLNQMLGQAPPDPKLHGVYKHGGVTFHVTTHVRERVLTGLAKMSKFLYETGLEPNAAVMWDFIPFSFIIDWFFPVNDTLTRISRNDYYTPQYYEYLDGVCCSMKYESKSAMGLAKRVYVRWYRPDPPLSDLGYAIFNSKYKPSSQVSAFRFIDGCCLLLRR